MSYRDDGYTGALAKSSGKKAAFIIFVDMEGKKRFFNEHGFHASIKDKEHTRILGGYYQELTEDQKMVYKNMEKRPEINSQKKYLDRRHRDNSYRRTKMHNDPLAAFEAKRNHRQDVEREQDEFIRQTGHINMPKPSRMFDANPLYMEDFLARRKEFRERWRDMLQFQKSKDGADGVLSKTFCYIGVTPACAVVTQGKNPAFLCIPLEISVVNFSLRDGITSRHTAHMMIDPCCVFRGKVDTEELLLQYDNGVKFARRTGVPQHFQEKSTMGEVWDMVKENCGLDAPIVCDTDNLNFVLSSLYNMAYVKDVSECALYQQRFDKNLCTMEDLAIAMKYAYSSQGEGNVEDTVKRFFEKEMQSVETFCPIHIRMRLDDMRRHYCQEARAAMNIQRLIDYLRSEAIWGMDTVFHTDKHIICTEHVGGERLPKMPIQPLLSSREGTGNKRLDNFMFSEPESEDEDAAIDAVTRQRLQQNVRGENHYRPEPNVITSVRVPTSPGPSRMPHEQVMTHDGGSDEPPPPVLGATARSLAQEEPSTSAPPPPIAGLQPSAKSYSIPPEFIFDWEIVSEEQFRKMTPWRETTGGFRY